MPLLLHNSYSIRGTLFLKLNNEYYKLNIMNIMTSDDDIHDVVEEQCSTWSVSEICKKKGECDEHLSAIFPNLYQFMVKKALLR